MEIINYTLTLIVSFLGLVIGIILAYIAKEELRAGKKYFILLQKVILTLIPSFFLFYFLKKNISLLIISILLFSMLINSYNKRIKTHYIYPFLALIFFFSHKNIDLFRLEAFLIFLYGFPTGSLLTKVTKKNYVKIVLQHISFVVIGLLLFILF